MKTKYIPKPAPFGNAKVYKGKDWPYPLADTLDDMGVSVEWGDCECYHIGNTLFVVKVACNAFVLLAIVQRKDDAYTLLWPTQ